MLSACDVHSEYGKSSYNPTGKPLAQSRRVSLAVCFITKNQCWHHVSTLSIDSQLLRDDPIGYERCLVDVLATMAMRKCSCGRFEDVCRVSVSTPRRSVRRWYWQTSVCVPFYPWRFWPIDGSRPCCVCLWVEEVGRQ